MRKIRWSWVLALVVGAVIGIAGTGIFVGRVPPGGPPQQQEQRARPAPAPQRGPEDPAAVYRVPVEDSAVKGPADALVTLAIFSDFECTFCKRLLPALARLEETFPGKLRIAFKHNPLGFHPRALPAAIAAEEAREQGGNARFWEMHDALFESAPSLDRAALEAAAQKVGLDASAFRRALDEERHLATIRRDQKLAAELGATGTPTTFVNGRKIVGAVPYEQLRAAVAQALAEAEAAVKAGVPAGQLYARIVEKGATAPALLPPGSAHAPPPPVPPAKQAAKVPLRPDDPSRGPAGARVTIALFSDFECPFCARVDPAMKRLEETFPGQLRIVWKHQPLPMHPNAVPAAIAAEAAHAQGKFWLMHDRLFANQRDLSPARFEQWAKELGLDVGRFRDDVARQAGRARVEQDQALAAQVGAQGTPTSFVNCRKVVGALPFESFRAIVEEELRKAEALEQQGVKGAAVYDRLCDENVRVLAAAVPAGPSAPPAPPLDAALVKRELRADDPARGREGAPLTLVVFSDFQCPYCSRAVPTLKQIESAYRDDVRIVWKHQPLPFHPHALPAAIAAEAARQQGKFWEMHDRLFERQGELSPDTYQRIAKELGLDLARFRAALEDPALRERVQQDRALAARLGISGTPTFLVGAEKVTGAVPFESFKPIIDRQLGALRAAR